MVSLLIGALLLVTAALKAHGLWTDPYSQESILLSPRLLVAVIEVEVVLGTWMLSGYAQRAAWLAALGFFALATMGSLYLALEGQRSCGCLPAFRPTGMLACLTRTNVLVRRRSLGE